MAQDERSWDVLLIGGASGVGKSSVSYRVAQHFGVGITEIDDIVEALKRMTTPEQQPILHYWDTHPEAAQLSPKEIVKLTVAVGEVLIPALEAVIANHLEGNVPIVLEGDYLLPWVAARTSYGEFANDERVRGVFIRESDEAQIVENYRLREPEEGEQTFRAHVSWLFGEWLKYEAERLGIAVVEARPWETVFERVLDAVR